MYCNLKPVFNYVLQQESHLAASDFFLHGKMGTYNPLQRNIYFLPKLETSKRIITEPLSVSFFLKIQRLACTLLGTVIYQHFLYQ